MLDRVEIKLKTMGVRCVRLSFFEHQPSGCYSICFNFSHKKSSRTAIRWHGSFHQYGLWDFQIPCWGRWNAQACSGDWYGPKPLRHVTVHLQPLRERTLYG